MQDLYHQQYLPSSNLPRTFEASKRRACRLYRSGKGSGFGVKSCRGLNSYQDYCRGEGHSYCNFFAQYTQNPVLTAKAPIEGVGELDSKLSESTIARSSWIRSFQKSTNPKP